MRIIHSFSGPFTSTRSNPTIATQLSTTHRQRRLLSLRLETKAIQDHSYWQYGRWYWPVGDAVGPLLSPTRCGKSVRLSSTTKCEAFGSAALRGRVSPWPECRWVPCPLPPEYGRTSSTHHWVAPPLSYSARVPLLSYSSTVVYFPVLAVASSSSLPAEQE